MLTLITKCLILLIRHAFFLAFLELLGTATIDMLHKAANSWTNGPVSITKLNNALFNSEVNMQ